MEQAYERRARHLKSLKQAKELIEGVKRESRISSIAYLNNALTELGTCIDWEQKHLDHEMEILRKRSRGGFGTTAASS